LSRETEFWHRRYTQQVLWTLATRRHIFDRISARTSQSILEVGCGSGAVLESLKKDGFSNTIGLDIDFQTLRLAIPKPVLTATGLNIPFENHKFNICLCHFLLLWVADPLKLLSEMKHVVKPGGWVVALAEPDYGGRIDYPPELEPLGKAQSQALQGQCADVSIGRKLKSLFVDCGLAKIQSGIISAEWGQNFGQADFDLEWSVLKKDLMWKISPEELDSYFKIDLEASKQSRRVLFVPIFYAFGQVTERF
jgi:SAM-dependent methyltransferase